MPQPVAASTSMWRNKKLLLVYGANTLSVMGDGFHSIALGFWILSTTGSALAMTAFMVTHMIISMLLGTFTGTIADRHSRRGIMLTSDALRFAFVIGIVLMMWLYPQFVLILVLSAMLGVVAQFHGPAFAASITTLAGKEQVEKATGMMQVTDTIARLIGLSMGGFLVAALGAQSALLIDAGTFFFSGLLIFAAGKFPSHKEESEEKVPFWSDLKKGFSYIRNHPFALSIAILMPTITFFFTSSMMLFQVTAVNLWNANAFEFGLIESAIPLGYACGAGIVIVLASKWGRRGWLLCTAVLCAGPILMFLSTMSGVYEALPFVFLLGVCLAFGMTVGITLLRTKTDEAYQGRIFGVIGSLSNVATPLGLGVSGFFADFYGADVVLLINGALLTLFALLCVLTLKPLRNAN
ncbi:MFS transporter [Marinicrinis sediminis]|uniref:MFS transporter n=1 Tax=Marinicrinis sediminis TaxID=1652465 RepID=A0ABW5REK4_9BACL